MLAVGYFPFRQQGSTLDMRWVLGKSMGIHRRMIGWE